MNVYEYQFTERFQLKMAYGIIASGKSDTGGLSKPKSRVRVKQVY